MFLIFLSKWISIKNQNLLAHIDIIKHGRQFSLLADGNEFFIDTKNFVLKKTVYNLYLNGVEMGTINLRKFFSVGVVEYEMKCQSNNEEHNLYFLILFISQSLNMI